MIAMYHVILCLPWYLNVSVRDSRVLSWTALHPVSVSRSPCIKIPIIRLPQILNYRLDSPHTFPRTPGPVPGPGTPQTSRDTCWRRTRDTWPGERWLNLNWGFLFASQCPCVTVLSWGRSLRHPRRSSPPPGPDRRWGRAPGPRTSPGVNIL